MFRLDGEQNQWLFLQLSDAINREAGGLDLLINRAAPLSRWMHCQLAILLIPLIK